MRRFLSSLILSGLLFMPSLAAHAALGDAAGALQTTGRGAFGAGAVSSELSLESMAGNIIKTFVSVLGVLFLILIIYAGYLWMNARGNEQQVEKAKNILTQAVIGLVVIMAAYLITDFVVGNIITAAGGA